MSCVQEIRKLCERHFSKIASCKNDAAGHAGRFDPLFRMILEKVSKGEDQSAMMSSLVALKQKFQVNDFQALRALSRYDPRHEVTCTKFFRLYMPCSKIMLLRSGITRMIKLDNAPVCLVQTPLPCLPRPTLRYCIREMSH
jgi:hypothetical protein